MKLFLKVCGMKWNTEEVAALQPSYLGFIFYDKSPRNYTGPSVPISENVRKVGVFVNDSVENILKKVKDHSLSVLQLHGDEDSLFVEEVRRILDSLGLAYVAIWKVFSIGESFNFHQLRDFEPQVEAFLFDTETHQRGGSGKPFNWELLKAYVYKKPFILSGGIGLDNVKELKELIEQESLPIIGIDVNSKFEIEPGRKDISALKIFMDELSCK